MLSVLVYIAGLTPNIVLYDARVFVKYFAYCLPVLVPMTTASFFEVKSVFWMVVGIGVVALFLSWMIFGAAILKWMNVEGIN